MDERSTVAMSSNDLAQQWVTEYLTCLETRGSSTTLHQLKKLVYEDNHPLVVSFKDRSWPVVASAGDHEQTTMLVDFNEGGGFPKTENLKLHGSPEGHEARNATDQTNMDSDSHQDDKEMTNIAIMKAAFLSSRCTNDQDPVPGADSVGVNLCVKCSSRGGEIMVCSSKACEVRVHRSCLVSATAHDQIVSFCCPFCAYSQAVSVCREAKRKVMLARKELMSFIGDDPTPELMEGLEPRLVEEAGEKGWQGCNSPTEEEFPEWTEMEEKKLEEGV